MAESKSHWLSLLEQMYCIKGSKIVCPKHNGLLTIKFKDQVLHLAGSENERWSGAGSYELFPAEKASIKDNYIFWSEHFEEERIENQETYDVEIEYAMTDNIFCLIDDIQYVKISTKG